MYRVLAQMCDRQYEPHNKGNCMNNNCYSCSWIFDMDNFRQFFPKQLKENQFIRIGTNTYNNHEFYRSLLSLHCIYISSLFTHVDMKTTQNIGKELHIEIKRTTGWIMPFCCFSLCYHGKLVTIVSASMVNWICHSWSLKFEAFFFCFD